MLLQQLSHLKSTGADKTELIPIYVSLAQTYKDDKQYDKAIENYQAEIRCRGDGEGDQVGVLCSLCVGTDRES